jgi:hypothetical protein
MYAFGSQVVRPDGSGYHFNTPQTEDTLSYLKEVFDEGCAWEVLESLAEVEFATRKALFVTGSLSDLTYQASEFERLSNDDTWTVLGWTFLRHVRGYARREFSHLAGYQVVDLCGTAGEINKRFWHVPNAVFIDGFLSRLCQRKSAMGCCARIDSPCPT